MPCYLCCRAEVNLETSAAAALTKLGVEFVEPERWNCCGAVFSLADDDQYIRGCGCRGGVCGACATVYRKPGEYKIRTGLACQTVLRCTPSQQFVAVRMAAVG